MLWHIPANHDRRTGDSECVFRCEPRPAASGGSQPPNVRCVDAGPDTRRVDGSGWSASVFL